MNTRNKIVAEAILFVLLTTCIGAIVADAIVGFCIGSAIAVIALTFLDNSIL